MLHSKFARLTAAELQFLHSQLQLRLVGAMAEIDRMEIPDIRRLEVLGTRLQMTARDLMVVEAEVVERDMLDSLPDCTGPEELAQVMAFIQ
jgi:hypothetical protein